MLIDSLRLELLAMRAEDRQVRQELQDANELGGHYVPQMEAVHVKNAARLRELIAQHGWPAEALAGKDGAEAAWLIAQHAIGEPDFQHHVLQLLKACAAENRIPKWHAAYLEDRIALYEHRPQRFGTQWLADPRDGRDRPWTLADPAHVNELRASVGLGPLQLIPARGPALPAGRRAALEENYRWWQDWLSSKGWP
ncbi:MAG TPA: DUF6624 domain-containing protein [Candidatus Cybelea sp.]|nr:DUF6624 domain-containing protein [Candidatus Cybelea sp.]